MLLVLDHVLDAESGTSIELLVFRGNKEAADEQEKRLPKVQEIYIHNRRTVRDIIN